MNDIERKAIEDHIKECQKRIRVAEELLQINPDRDMRTIARLKTVISALRELQQYRQIGTLENCYEANRRQSEMIIKDVKKSECPEDIKTYGAEALFGYCPNCGELNNNIWNDKCCGNCGQALEWKGENDEQTDEKG